MLRRPIVLAALIAIFEIVFVLTLPEHYTTFIFFALLLLGASIFACIKAKKKEVLLLLIPTIVLCAVFPYFTFNKYEKASMDLVADLQKEQTPEFVATVDECKTYSSYSQIFVSIKDAGGKKLEYPLKARVGCFSPLYLDKGDTLVFTGNPISVSEIENDDFDTTSYLKSKKVFIDIPSCSVISSSGSTETSLISSLRNYTRKVIYKYVDRDMEFKTASLCYAMFAGDKNSIPKEIKDSFSESGLSHILCVSGMHLTLLAGTLFIILSFFSVHKKTKCVLIICLCVFYTIFTGFSLSATRACIMCILSYTGMIIGRKTDGYISLFLSLLVILFFSPYSIFDISLILSFCATLGILALSEFSVKYTGKNIILKAICTLFDTFLANLGAVIFTLPVCAFSFGGVSIMSIASTMTVSVIFEVLLTLLLLLVAVSPISFISLEAIPDLIGKISDLLCYAIIKISDFFSYFRYAKITSVSSELFISVFAFLVLILSVFIAIENSFARRLTAAFVIVLGVVFCIVSLVFTIHDDNQYKVSYFRQNENDRQLSVKLATKGYLLINADDILCLDKDKLPFDYKYKNNYLLIIPDKNISVAVLAQNIKIFNDRFGFEEILVPFTNDGKLLSDELLSYGIDCNYISEDFTVKDISVKHTFDENAFYLDIDDGTTHTGILFAEKYTPEYFGDDTDICAFFTRKTKNQFNPDKDIMPKCDEFITRLKKGASLENTTNTFGKKTVIIKG